MSTPDPALTETDKQEDLLTEESSISEEDRREILADIEDVVRQNRITVTDDLFQIKPLKRGIFLPTFINLLAILAVGAAFFFSARLFEARQDTMNLQVQAITSAEGRLIQELKKESAAQIAQKEAEISKIQDELKRIETQSQSLQQNFESALKQREAELRAEMEAALAKERSRLQNLDISPDEIDARLREFEIQKQQELQSKLQEFRIQSQKEMQAKEEELQRSREAAQKILQEANTQKEAILKEAADREAQLTARYEAERQQLQEASSAAQARLQEISRLQETENLLTDQILASYQSIMNRMNNEEFEAALSEINSLLNLLDDPRIDSIPRIAKRRGVERFILNTLRNEIEVKLNAESADTTGLVDAAQRLFNARALVAQGETALSEGRDSDAKELFRKAVASVPAIQTAVTRLETLDTRERNALSQQYLTQGENFLTQGNTEKALASYRQAAEAAAVGTSDAVKSALGRLEDTIIQRNSSELRAQNTTALENLRKEYEDRISQLETESSATDADLRQRIADALDTIEKNEQDLKAKDAEIADLNKTIEDGKKLLDEYRTRAEAAETELANIPEDRGGSLSDDQIASLKAEYTARLNDRETQIKALSEKVSTTEAQLQSAQQSLSRSEKQRKQLENDLNAAVVELVDVVTRRQGDDRYAALAKGYSAYQARLSSLLSGDSPADYRKAEDVLNQFFNDRDIRQVFPDLGTYNEKVTEYRVNTAEEQGREAGREAALSETENYATLLENSNFNEADKIEQKAADDELFLRAIEKIRALAENR